jgi:type IV secretion system protein TrbJ
MTSTRKKTAVIAALTLAAAAPAWAIFGLGDIVFDPTNYAEAVQHLIQLQQQYMQLVQLYQQTRQQYDQMIWMARSVPVDMNARYRAVATPWINSQALNTYGNTAGWVSGINTGSGVAAGYGQATQTLNDYGAAFGTIPGDQAQRVKTSYATVELTDGANLEGIETVGRLRANAPSVESTLEALEADSLSSDPAMNTEIAVLNKINAANLIGLRSAQDANKLLASLAEEQIVSAKRTRDAESAAINEHVRFMTEGKAVLDAQASGASSAMLAWRMP